MNRRPEGRGGGRPGGSAAGGDDGRRDAAGGLCRQGAQLPGDGRAPGGAHGAGCEDMSELALARWCSSHSVRSYQEARTACWCNVYACSRWICGRKHTACSRGIRSGRFLDSQIPRCLPAQLGSKGFGDPVTFDNAYYTALQQKPWAGAPKDSMAAMIGLPSDKVTTWAAVCTVPAMPPLPAALSPDKVLDRKQQDAAVSWQILPVCWSLGATEHLCCLAQGTS